MPSALTSQQAAHCRVLLDDLRGCFGQRLHAVVAYGPGVFPEHQAPSARVPLNTLALVEAVGRDDLEAMARRAEAWHRSGLAMPLVLGRDEFARSLDAFPVEFGNIIAHHVVLAGEDPFKDLSVSGSDLRRTCETLAKSHLIHLRGAFLETRGRPADLAVVVRDSAPPLAALLGAMAILSGEQADGPAQLADFAERHAGASSTTLRQVLESIYVPELSNDEARRLYPEYVTAIERLVTYVDRLDK